MEPTFPPAQMRQLIRSSSKRELETVEVTHGEDTGNRQKKIVGWLEDGWIFRNSLSLF